MQATLNEGALDPGQIQGTSACATGAHVNVHAFVHVQGASACAKGAHVKVHAFVHVHKIKTSLSILGAFRFLFGASSITRV